MIDFSEGIALWQGWAAAGVVAMLIGIAKTGVPGVGILAVVLLASVMDVKQSVGFLLPILIMGDCFALKFYRRHADWPQLARLMPAALVGIVIGYFLMERITSAQLRPLLGGIVMVLLALDGLRERLPVSADAPSHGSVGVAVGVAAGITTTLANAAGPLIAVYFLSMRFDKHRFIGTAAWYFFVLNCTKVPFFIAQTPPLITGRSVLGNLCLLPAVAAGALLGVFLLRKIPQKWFVVLVRILTALAAARLALG